MEWQNSRRSRACGDEPGHPIFRPKKGMAGDINKLADQINDNTILTCDFRSLWQKSIEMGNALKSKADGLEDVYQRSQGEVGGPMARPAISSAPRGWCIPA
jgi:hypothetical protein